jgi:cytoskeletal protein CcmA (bactofilin family)
MAIFGEKKELERKETAVIPPKQETTTVSGRTGELHTLLGKGSEFEGKLAFEGQVRIDGKYSGQIQTKDLLVIGESARVTAEISAGTVVVNGMVEGTIRATTLVELHPPARVKGTIETPALAMEKGVIFEGTTKMENLAGKAPPVPAMPPAPK